MYNQGIPTDCTYADKTITNTLVGDGSTSVFELGFTPKSVNEFEIFVAGKRLKKDSNTVI